MEDLTKEEFREVMDLVHQGQDEYKKLLRVEDKDKESYEEQLNLLERIEEKLEATYRIRFM